MAELPRFLHGSRYAELFSTEQGLLIIEGLVAIQGDTAQISEVLIEPFEAPVLVIGVRAVLDIRRELLRQVRDEGSTELELTGIRVSGAHPNRPVRIRRRL